ncbi:MAG: pyruvate ferredoxin oxidoreductase subunit gamma [candidate division Zixibacteria bacterium]|nr:pyruvate ferredoxin oxidoreductase subunit gamma [candidate division Zixibacteria bacterium]
MKELRLHGRGGQGVVTAAELVAQAAFADKKYSQAFPSFGSERMGAPVTSFVRISDDAIRCRNQIYTPDYLIVQDATLIGTVDVTAGLKPDGLMIIDTEKDPGELKLDTKATVMTIPASHIAQEIIGRPIQNTTLLGYFAAVTGLISFDGVKLALKHRFPAAIAIKNIKAVEKAFSLAKEVAHV